MMSIQSLRGHTVFDSSFLFIKRDSYKVKDRYMKILLEDITVFTIAGKKHLYKLGDMTYGEWLIFKDNFPIYYLDISDELYKDIDESIKKDPYNYLKDKFKRGKEGFSLCQGIKGIWSSRVDDKLFDMEKLPVSFFMDF